MANDVKECELCSWPLDCCTEDGALTAKPVTADCPRDHQMWERRLSEARLSLVSGVSMKELAALEEEQELVGV